MLDFLRNTLSANPTRAIAYASSAAVGAALFVAGQLDLEIPSDVTAAIALITTFIATELIRHFVTSPATVATLTTEHEAEVAAILAPPGSSVESVAPEPFPIT